MIKLGIIGYPLGHTLSPFMQGAALEHAGLDGEYIKLETKPDKLKEKIEYLKDAGYTGVNVTIPFKVEVMEYLDIVDPLAEFTGAVNTVKFNMDGTLSGYNTDVYGFIEALSKDQRTFLRGKTAAVLGTGGAARAVLMGFSQMGLDRIVFYARNIEKAQNFIDGAGLKFRKIKIELQPLNEDIDLSYAAIVVNTTPLGMYGKYEGLSPVSQKSIKTLPRDGIVYDIVYKPRTTKFLEYAKESGLITVEGIEMLVLQGAKAFEIWTGANASAEVMREAAIKHL